MPPSPKKMLAMREHFMIPAEKKIFISMQISFGVVDLKHSPYFIPESVNAINGDLVHKKENCPQIIVIVWILLKSFLFFPLLFPFLVRAGVKNASHHVGSNIRSIMG